MKKKTSKKRKANPMFESMMAGAREAVAFARGELDPSTYRIHVPVKVDVKTIRQDMHLTQQEFCRRYGFVLPTLRDWEQGNSTPAGPLRAYLKVIAHNPKAVKKALETAD